MSTLIEADSTRRLFIFSLSARHGEGAEMQPYHAVGYIVAPDPETARAAALARWEESMPTGEGYYHHGIAMEEITIVPRRVEVDWAIRLEGETIP